jgi:hypothetical protein
VKVLPAYDNRCRDHALDQASLEVRLRLLRLGSSIAPAEHDLKKFLRTRCGWLHCPIEGCALITIPPNHVLLDPDSEQGVALLRSFDLPDTLTLRGRFYDRLLFRFPLEVRFDQQVRVRPGLDVITGRMLAPGSTYEGITYRVVSDAPIAELPREIARLLQPDCPRHPLNLEFVVGPAPAEQSRRTAAANRRAAGRTARAASRSTAPSAQKSSSAARCTGDSMAKRQAWLATTHDGSRYRALGSLACQMYSFGETYEEFEALVKAHPVRSKLKGQSPNWLRRHIWDTAVAKVEQSRPVTSGPGESPHLTIWQEQALPVLREWLDHGVVLLTGMRMKPNVLARRLDLLDLHAVTFYDYGLYGQLDFGFVQEGPCYFLAESRMRSFLGCASGSCVSADLRYLGRVGLLRALPRDDFDVKQATYYQPMINSRPLLPPTPGSST